MYVFVWLYKQCMHACIPCASDSTTHAFRKQAMARTRVANHPRATCDSQVARGSYSRLHLECHLISISNLNLSSLFSTEVAKET